MKITKISYALIGMCLSLIIPFIPTEVITASESDKDDRMEAVYDLIEGGTQQFMLEDENGQEICITISEISDGSHHRLLNKTYRISYDLPFAWKAGYNVVVKNDTISSVNSAYIDTYIGSAQNKKLVKESLKQATLYFDYISLGVQSNCGVRTKIVGSEMEVSIL